jgi:uridine kinase
MEETYKITLSDNRVIDVKKNTTLLEIAKNSFPSPKRPFLGALVDNSIRDLWETPDKDCNVSFVDITHPDGSKIYVRGLSMVLAMANHELFPDRHLKIVHSLSKGLYCRWDNNIPMKSSDLTALTEKMTEIIKKDIPFAGKIIEKEEASEIFEKMNKMDKVTLIKFRKKDFIRLYFCDNYPDYFFGRLPHGTGVVDKFELIICPPGLVLRYPNHYSPDRIPVFEPQFQHASIYKEYRRWGEILEVFDVASLNSIIMKGEINDLIRIAEALHEKKIAAIADQIKNNRDRLRVILIAGPSSSGKTTFAQRLIVQLKVNGLKPVAISLDDYYLDNDKTPRDEYGKPDLDHINAIDLHLFNDHLEKLLAGERILRPRFDFTKGQRSSDTKELKVPGNNILIVEGIHGLNPLMSESIHPDNKYKIYVSPLTQLNLDNHNRIPTTDNRIIRRIVRDSQFRNYNALQTVSNWPMVRRGEERFIFPFQEEAHIMFNSVLIYELGVLKAFVEPLLLEIPKSLPEYAEAKRILSFTGNFLPIGTEAVPANSILREFIGATCFSH